VGSTATYLYQRIDTGLVTPVLFVALLVVPIAELWVIVRVADRLGVASTLALLVLVSIAGAWLLKQQGVATWRRLQRTLGAGHMPTEEVSDGALILLGGALLLTPGFLTDLVGLALLLPPTRAIVKRVARRRFGRWAGRRIGVRDRARIYTTTATPRPGPDGAPATPPTPPRAVPPPRGDGGDDSRGTG
jgi:UPF0716 protein FxsA